MFERANVVATVHTYELEWIADRLLCGLVSWSEWKLRTDGVCVLVTYHTEISIYSTEDLLRASAAAAEILLHCRRVMIIQGTQLCSNIREKRM